jgi:hypothetical protein
MDPVIPDVSDVLGPKIAATPSASSSQTAKGLGKIRYRNNNNRNKVYLINCPFSPMRSALKLSVREI